MDDIKTKNKELQNLDLSGTATPQSKQLQPLTTAVGTQKSNSTKYLFGFFLIAGIALLILGLKIIAFIALGLAILFFFTQGLVKKSLSLSNTASSQQASLPAQKSLKNILFSAQYLENVENYGEKVFSQYELLEEKYKFYQNLLASKFSPSEITYQRYASPVENIYQAITENFLRINNSLMVLSKMDNRESDTYNKSLTGVKELLALNQAAILQLDKLSFALNEIKSSQSSSEEDLKIMMKDLQELADRAHKYSL